MQEVTIVIPNYNGLHYMKKCLDALNKQTLHDVNIIVVDNGSSDGSISFLKEIYPGVRVISLKKNYGFCRAVNIGIKSARTPFVILLNNDTEVEEAFAEELLKAVKGSERIFSCQAKMLNYHKKDEIDDAGDLYCALGWAFARGKGQKDSHYRDESNIFASCGGAAIYRREYFKEIGYFDERHFAYLEDIDVGYRARIHGYVNRYVPTARVYHIGSGTTGSRYNDTKVRLAARNSIYLAYKNMPVVQLIINAPLFAVGIFTKQIFFLTKHLGLAHAKGVFQGFGMCRKEYKVSFKREYFKNYAAIQLELWSNILKRGQ